MALTNKKRIYAEARIEGLGQRDAAIKAGCPARTASQAASRYEKDADVQAAMGRTVAVMPEKKKVERPDKFARSNKEPHVDPATYIPAQAEDPIAFFKAVMNDLAADPKLRLDAAKSLAAFTVAKPGESGKKEERKNAAKVAAGGKFGAGAPPRLVRDNTK